MWYVMQVRTGTEENIRCQCQRLISSNVLERCFIPYYQQKKRFQGEWHIRRIDRHKRIAYLEIEMFGRTVEMKVGLEIIRKE